MKSNRFSKLEQGVFKVKVRGTVTQSAFTEDLCLGKNKKGLLMKNAVMIGMERYQSTLDPEALRLISSQEAPSSSTTDCIGEPSVEILSLMTRQPGGGVTNLAEVVQPRGILGKRAREGDVVLLSNTGDYIETGGFDDPEMPSDLYGEDNGLSKYVQFE